MDYAYAQCSMRSAFLVAQKILNNCYNILFLVYWLNARIQWHALKKVVHYYLLIGAVSPNQCRQGREKSLTERKRDDDFLLLEIPTLNH
jgi:hypothetical protein